MTTTTASRIRTLSPEIASQIAAGEVIERPANACKELIENAIDSGARRIEIEIEAGGKRLIRVRDDGCGMTAEDAVLSLQRHATSKLRETEDLYSLRTLGFRGEALPSIAAVSRFEMTTRPQNDDIGTRLVVEAGVVADISEVGCATGTEIVVQNLFHNIPARFKFLKSDVAEAGRVNEMVGHMALAYPEISFVLRNNGNEVVRSEAGGNAFNALVCVMGAEIGRQMLPLADSHVEENNGMKVTGFAGRPQLTRGNRNGQLIFVNGRVIKNRTLQHAINMAYEGMMHGKDRFPLAVVFLQMPPGAVDVNVHPTKSEVRFAREWEVHHAVRVAIRDTLVAAHLTPDWGFATGAPITGPFGSTQTVDANGEMVPNGEGATGGEIGALPDFQRPTDFGAFSRPLAPRHNGDMTAFRAAQQGFNNTNNWRNGDQNLLPDVAPPEGSYEERRLSLRPLGQISNNAYILCEGEDGLYIVCQHRAHERILADKAIAAAEGKPVESQRLVIPFTAEVGPRAAAAIEESTSLLKDLGFEIEAFGGSSVLIRAVPYLVARGDYEAAFRDLVDELIGGGNAGRNLQERRRALLTMMSCKNAIKAGDPLGTEQIRGLLDDLLLLNNPSICPHGQPILIKISMFELDKKFEREYASR